VLVYTAVLGALVSAMAVSLWLRTPFKVDVIRDHRDMGRLVAGGKIENVYRLQVMNATESAQRYRIHASGLPGLLVISEPVVTVAPTEARSVAVRIQTPFDAAPPGSHRIEFEIDALDSPGHLSEKSVFLIPR
jgi:polyferredoxin